MDPLQAVVLNIEKKKERKNPPLLYNLAELQNECSRLLKTSPDETLRIVQELYERKLVTYRERMPVYLECSGKGDRTESEGTQAVWNHC